MRKVLLSILVVFMLLSVFSFSPSRAHAAGIIQYAGGSFVIGKGISFVFHASGLRNRDVRGASIFVGSDFHPLGCTVNRAEERVVCVLRGGLTEYAGETGILYLGGQIFYVTIPGMKEPPEDESEEGEEAPACGEFEALGAWVIYYLEGVFDSEEFIEADSAEEVEQEAAQTASEEPGMTYKVGDFGCHEAPGQIPE